MPSSSESPASPPPVTGFLELCVGGSLESVLLLSLSSTRRELAPRMWLWLVGVPEAVPVCPVERSFSVCPERPRRVCGPSVCPGARESLSSPWRGPQSHERESTSRRWGEGLREGFPSASCRRGLLCCTLRKG